MHIESIYNPQKSDEIHVVAGQPSPELWESHVMYKMPIMNVSAWPLSGRYLSDLGVQLRFIPQFAGTVTGHVHEGFGIRVNQSTGQISADPLLPDQRPYNFVLDVVATDIVDGSEVYEHRLKFRVHVHQRMERVWLTPDTLSLRRKLPTGEEYRIARFSVRADFDDGVVADITGSNYLEWSEGEPGWTSPPVNVDGSGWLSITSANEHLDIVKIRVRIDYDHTLHAEAELRVLRPWSREPAITAQLIPGGALAPGASLAMLERHPNVLLLCDGLTDTDSDKEDFEAYTQSLVDGLRSNALLAPFNLLASSFNFWRAFTPSDEYGASLCGTVTTTHRQLLAKILAENRPFSNLIDRIGLPTRRDAPSTGRTHEQILEDWEVVYGLERNELGNAKKTVQDWRGLWPLGMADEVDTPLYVGAGSLKYETCYDLGFMAERSDRDRLNEFLSRLQARVLNVEGIAENQPIGHLWMASSGANKPKDYGLVVFIVPQKARALNTGGAIFIPAFDRAQFIQGHVDSNRFEIPTESFPRVAQPVSVNTFAHELAHSFGLGDEYGEKIYAPRGTISAHGNVQEDGGTMRREGLDGAEIYRMYGEEIKWNWHRISHARVVDGTITNSGEIFTVPLRAFDNIHLGDIPFDVNDIVHLRERSSNTPLRKKPRVSIAFSVVAVSTDRLELRAISPESNYPDYVPKVSTVATFREGSIIFRPVTDPAPLPSPAPTNYHYARLIATNIRDYITRHHAPLTQWSTVDFPQGRSTVDPRVEQMPDLIRDRESFFIGPYAFLRIPDAAAQFPTRIVGAYSGGDTYHIGMLHPTGKCIMRHNQTDWAEFCAVCSYVLVDMIEPHLHGKLDREIIATRYPQA
ncbi:MAG: hypothetical protein ABI432_02580 [Flavobacteriales bacterium]